MRKETRFKLVLVPLVSAALLTLGCTDETSSASTPRICMDAYGRRVPDGQCSLGGNRSSFYHWYHLSRGGAVPGVGEVAHNGSFHGQGSVSRGGFGSSAHGFGHLGE